MMKKINNSKIYKTHEIAEIIGVHPNTVRLYEEIEFIEAPKRLSNGYRAFTQLHIDQMKVARIALKGQLLQNGLRKKAINIIKLIAKRKFKIALCETHEYINMLQHELDNAIEAIKIVESIIQGNESEDDTIELTRKQVADKLDITIDTVRNWELNGLITVKRKKNGYRIYNGDDIKILKIIRSLRCANYSLSSILRLLNSLHSHQKINVTYILDTPDPEDDIISVYDKLLSSLNSTKEDAEKMVISIKKMINNKYE